MGMAASQVRFLSLQNRKNTIGRQLSTLSNRKTSLARDMKTVSRNFTNALNQTHLKWSNDCGANYHNLSYDMLMKPNDVNAEVPYILTNANNGRVVLNDSAILDLDGNPIKATAPITLPDGQVIETDNALSYINIAKMISSFKEVDNQTNKPVYDATGAYGLNDQNVLVGKPAVTNGYYIPDTVDFNFKNNLRFQIFELMIMLFFLQLLEPREYCQMHHLVILLPLSIVLVQFHMFQQFFLY